MAAKYTKIKEFICQQIETGQWPEHSKVPSENELAEQFSVSRMTARRALQELTEQGILERTQGAGTFVANLKSQSSLLEIRNIADEIRARGHQHSALVLSLVARKATSELALLFNLANNASLFYSEILHFENNQPIQLERRYVNAALVPDYLQQDFVRLTTHEYLSKEAPLTEATHEVEAVLAGVDFAKKLAIVAEEPCLLVKRRTWSSQGVVSFAILISPGSRYKLGGHLTF